MRCQPTLGGANSVERILNKPLDMATRTTAKIYPFCLRASAWPCARPQASDLAVAGDARWGSRPMAEHRVMSGASLA
jgi:hypothetical protein